MLGFIIFVLVGYRIGIEFGTFGGRLLADDLVPNDIAYQNLQGIVMSVGTVLGIVLAFLCTLSFFLIIGAIAGDLFGRLTLLVFRSRGESG